MLPTQDSSVQCERLFSVKAAQAEDVFDVPELLAEHINMGSENGS